MATMETLSTVEVRKVAREFGVPPSAGTRYHRRENIIERISIEVAAGRLGGQAALDAIVARHGMATATTAGATGAATMTEAALIGHLSAFVRSASAASMSGLGREEVSAMIEDAVREITVPLRVEVSLNGKPPTVGAGTRHHLYPMLLSLVAAGHQVWISGPAGSGKTMAVEQVATDLGLPFYFNGAIDSEYKLTGFVDAAGRVVSTPFRRAYEGGGIYLFDEVDASSASATLALNAALANGICPFPGSDTPIKRHPDCRIIAAANTFGYGADSKYVGRNRLDAAFIDRFAAKLHWDYDEALELALGLDQAWTKRVQALRKLALEKGLHVVISTRAAIAGGRMLQDGIDRETVERLTITGAIGAEARKALGVA